jgi:FAD/FMN-containing dehydrogenase/Fe-S oxidoreductase
MTNRLQNHEALQKQDSVDRRLIRRAPSGRIESASVATPGDPERLRADLAREIEGEVSFDAGSRALYATDSSNYRQVPIGVVLPRTTQDVLRTVEICRRFGAPLLPRGGGTSLSGETCNSAVVLDFSRYLNRLLDLDPEARLARVQPGCILDTVRDAAEVHHLTFGPDPATHDHNSIGGMIGNNSGGVHAVMAGLTVHNIQSLDVVTYDGLRFTVGPTSDDELRAILLAGGRRAEIYRRLDALRARYGDLIRARFPKIPRRVSGYENLDELLPENGFNVARALVGTEGTCVTVLEAMLNLVSSPPGRTMVILGFPDIFQAADAVPRVLKFRPIGLEGMDRLLVEDVKARHLYAGDIEVLPDGDGWLIVQMGGDNEEEATARAQDLVDSFTKTQGVNAKLIRDKAKREGIWKVREASLAATVWVPNRPDTWPGWEDSAVHPEGLGAYLRELKSLFHRYGYEASVYGHFGDGLVHCRVPFDLYDERGIAHWRQFLGEAADLVVRYDGSLSGEHGDGQARAELIEKMYGPELVEAFREFKAIWDPAGKMNPGKVIDPYPITSNLRLGPDYRPPDVTTHFAFPHDRGSFARAALRCVGVGECRRVHSDGGVMCPSYLVTHQEKHSTRGRARLLFEMMRGDPIRDGWKSNEVEDALSLCLACKGCKSDCPVNVDMATYKAEFRAHHYHWRIRHRSAYSMGRVYWWARLASAMPLLANAATQLPLLRNATKSLGGIAQERSLPRFAREPFTTWFRRRDRVATGGQRVLLWPDTFNNFFRPETAKAATAVLEAAGFEVVIPARPLCCGRPLYDWGWLKPAKRLWRQTLDTLHSEIEAGTPLIGLEPACLAAFQDELANLFPEDERAKRLREQSVFFSDFVAAHAELFPDLRIPREVLVQIHCHHHAVIDYAGERSLLDRLGVDYTLAPSGCCGMAGAFGFANDTYDVSMAAAERVLLPKIREARPETRILANGFSCREQIEQCTGRSTLHIAELIAQELRG